MMRTIDKSTAEFVDLLASDAPAPGGGGAAALAGALGAALGHMVGALTVGKKRYADVEQDMRALMAQCEQLQSELLDQVQADEEGFLPLAEAYGIPKEDPARAETLEKASAAACEAPLRICALCCEGIETVGLLAEKGSSLAVSDAGCAAALLRGALESAAMNVFINTRTMKDRETAERMNRLCLTMLAQAGTRADAIARSVRERLLAPAAE